VDLRDDVEQQQLGELLGVEAIVLPLGAEDQPQLGGVCDGDVVGERADLLVEVPVAAGCFVAEAERLVELPQAIDDGRARGPVTSKRLTRPPLALRMHSDD